MMADKFYKEHDFSFSVILVGLFVTMSLTIGGGMSCALMTFLLQSWFSEFTDNNLAIVTGLSLLITTFWVVYPNMYLLIVRGKPKFVTIMNKIMVGVQFLIYLLALLFIDHEYKWFDLSFSIFPFFSYRLMASRKYHTLLVYYESIKQDPEGFRRHFFERLEK